MLNPSTLSCIRDALMKTYRVDEATLRDLAKEKYGAGAPSIASRILAQDSAITWKSLVILLELLNIEDAEMHLEITNKGDSAPTKITAT